MQGQWPLLSFEMASPALLGWLIVALAPWLIHLWTRRRYQVMPWAAMEYVLAAIRESRRRIRLEQWLLLLLRTVIVLLVVVAAAEPFLQSQGVTFVVGQRTHRVLVVDASYSMEYVADRTSRLDRAKRLAREIVEQSNQGDGLSLVAMGMPPQVLIGSPVFAARDFLLEVDALEAAHTSMDLPATLAQVEQIVAEARKEHPELKAAEVYFLSDLGRVGWRGQSGEENLGREDMRRLNRLTRLARLVILDVGQAEAGNLAVREIRHDDPFVLAGENLRIDAVVRNFGRRTCSGQSIELLVDQRRVDGVVRDVPANGEVTVSFSHRCQTSGPKRIEVRAVGDGLDVDNHRWLTLDVADRIDVLLVEGRLGVGAYDGSAGYLAHALEAVPEGGRPSRIRCQRVPESALPDTDLSRFRCVMLCDVGQFTRQEVEMLDRYLRLGGSVVFFLGPNVLPDRYNRELIEAKPEEAALLPGRLGQVVENPQYGIDPLEYAHPLVAPFRDAPQAGLLTAPVDRYFRVLIDESSHATVAARLLSGDPWIVEQPVHRGRVVLVATSADRTWTSWPLWPSFVPLVREILAFGVQGQDELRNLRVGEPIVVSQETLGGGTPGTVRTPDDRSESLRKTRSDERDAWTFDATWQSGFYVVSSEGDAAEGVTFALNVDCAESDLTKISATELRAEVWPGVPVEYQTSWDHPDGGPVMRTDRTSKTAETLLLVALLLLVVETYLARRFGRYGPAR